MEAGQGDRMKPRGWKKMLACLLPPDKLSLCHIPLVLHDERQCILPAAACFSLPRLAGAPAGAEEGVPSFDAAPKGSPCGAK
jgi:hypothetical protein